MKEFFSSKVIHERLEFLGLSEMVYLSCKGKKKLNLPILQYYGHLKALKVIDMRGNKFNKE